MSSKSTNIIPEGVNDYNVYTGGEKMIGVADDISFPEVSMKTIEISGAGILGTIDVPNIGQVEKLEQEISFNNLYSSYTDVLKPNRQVDLTFRAAMQSVDKSLGFDYKSLRVVERGRVKSFTPGKLKRADNMEAKVKIEVTYMLIEVNGDSVVELDKLNGIYKVNGEDMLSDISSMI